MDDTASFDLTSLLQAADHLGREVAWGNLISRHSRLILSVAASFGGGHDEVMDSYAYVLEKLRESDFRRLRAFQLDGTARFSTWLVFATRRLCVDHHRSRYGRTRPERAGDAAAALRTIRRRLLDSGDPTDVELLPDASDSADARLDAEGRAATLKTAMAALTARERLLLKLRFEDDLPASRIAAIVGLPTPFHVYRQLNATLSRLRTTLRAAGIQASDD